MKTIETCKKVKILLNMYKFMASFDLIKQGL